MSYNLTALSGQVVVGKQQEQEEIAGKAIESVFRRRRWWRGLALAARGSGSQLYSGRHRDFACV